MGQFEHPNVIFLQGVVTKANPIMIITGMLQGDSSVADLRGLSWVHWEYSLLEPSIREFLQPSLQIFSPCLVVPTLLQGDTSGCSPGFVDTKALVAV